MDCRKSFKNKEEESMINPIIFVLIYVLTLLLVATSMVGLSVSALIGALLMAFFGINSGLFTYQEALTFIDMRIIGLILGSMIVIEVAEKSGLFHLASLYAIQNFGGDPRRLFVVSCMMAALMSLFLGDAASWLLIGAASITAVKLFKLDPIPYIVSTAIMTNLGGTSTLIGSTSNMVIGVQSKLNFTEFLSYLMPIELVLWIITTIALYLAFRSRLQKNSVVTSYDPWKAVKNRRILLRSTMLLVIFLILLIISDQWEIGAESIALGCAILALIISDQEPSEILGHLD
jgi:Na+/H+ antiporter NhaD/arsenite permease-like protein